MSEREHDHRAQEQEHRGDEQQAGAPAPAVERPDARDRGAGSAIAFAIGLTARYAMPLRKARPRGVPYAAQISRSFFVSRTSRSRKISSVFSGASSAFWTASTMSFAAMSAQTGDGNG